MASPPPTKAIPTPLLALHKEKGEKTSFNLQWRSSLDSCICVMEAQLHTSGRHLATSALFTGGSDNTGGSRGAPASRLLCTQVALPLQGVNRLQCIAQHTMCSSNFDQTAFSSVILQTAMSRPLLHLQESSALLSSVFYCFNLFCNFFTPPPRLFQRVPLLLPPPRDRRVHSDLLFWEEKIALHQRGSHPLSLEGLCAALQPAEPVLGMTSSNTHWFCKRKI